MPGETWTRQAEPALHGEHGGYDCRASATARASPAVDVEMHRGSTPKRGDSPSRNADTVDAFLDSKKTRHGGRQVCTVYIMGSTFPTGVPHEEPDIERSPVTDQQDSDEEESPYVTRTCRFVAQTTSFPIRLAGPWARQSRRQAELDR